MSGKTIALCPSLPHILFYYHPLPLRRAINNTEIKAYLAKIALKYSSIFDPIFKRPLMAFAWPIPTMKGKSRLTIKTHAALGVWN